MNRNIVKTLSASGLPCAYSHFKKPMEPPFVVYIGAGLNKLEADDTHYWSENKYRVEYYFKQKDEQKEAELEQALLNGGFLFEKNDDVYISDEDVFVIYYTTN